MITSCANPTCNKPFHYLRGGRLYCFELRPGVLGASQRRRLAVYFWICEQCSDPLSLEFDTERGVLLRQSWEKKAAARQLHCDACQSV